MAHLEPLPNPVPSSLCPRRGAPALASRGRRGVTPVEIAAVVALVTLVGSLLAWFFGARNAGAAADNAAENARGIASAVVSWRTDHGEGCPSVTQLEHEGYLTRSTAHADAWGQRFRLACHSEAPVVYSAGPDGKAGTHDDIRVVVR